MKFAKIFVLFICVLSQVFAQQVTLYRVNVEGNTTTSDKMIKYSAGLRDGTQIQRSDISTAITRLWDLGLFEDVNIVLNNESQYGVDDLYRIKDESELKHLGIFSDQQETIKIIEWPQLIDIPLSHKLEIHLDYAKNENQREIKFIGSGKWEILNEL